MIIIDPYDINESNLISSNATNNDPDFYNSETEYKESDRVTVKSNNTIYEALQNNTGQNPLQDTQKRYWLPVGKTNKWRMFDGKVGSQTESNGSLIVKIKSSRVVNALSLFSLKGNLVNIKLEDSTEGVVYQKQFDLKNEKIDNWYDYFFKPFDRRRDVTFLDLPPYGNADLTIEVIESENSMAKIGLLVLGKQEIIGSSLFGSSVGIISYSLSNTDAFGNTEIIKRKSVKRGNFDILIDTKRVDYILRLLDSIRDRGIVFIAQEEYESTIIYGFYRDLDIVYSDVNNSDCSLRIVGL